MGLYPLRSGRLVPIEEELAAGANGLGVYPGPYGRNFLEAVFFHLSHDLRASADFYRVYGSGRFFGLVFESLAQIRVGGTGEDQR